MSVLLIGVNHRDLPLDIFERFAVAEDDVPKLLAALTGRDHVSEAVVLSTCNRTEIYVKAERFHGAFEDLRDLLVELSDVPPADFLPHLTVLWDDEAVEHLFGVAAGLDSAVLGETEVLGQVRSAQRLARAEGRLGPTLDLLFRHAVAVGRRVRTETGIARHTTSVAHAAVELAERDLDGLDGASVVVVGAGRMSTSMARSARSAGAQVGVANRTTARAEALADDVGGPVIEWERLAGALVAADAVLTGTGSDRPILEAALLGDVAARRRETGRASLVVVDIAVPRDVEAAARSLSGIRVRDMSDVAELTDEALDRRRLEVGAARALVEDEVLRYHNATTARAAGPVVAALRTRAEELRLVELDRHASRLAGLDPETRQLVEQVTRGMLNKVLHEPSVRMQQQAGTLRGDRLADALRDLFDLP